MPHPMWEVSKYDLNDLQTDHLLYLLHKMEWEEIFMLAIANEAFHKIIYKIRDRNMMLSPEMERFWKITDQYPYLKNITIMDDSSTPFREKIKQMKRIEKLRIHSCGSPIDYIMCDELQEVEICTSKPENVQPNVDYLVNILRINRNINLLVYTRGCLGNESIYHMMKNKISKLKLASIYIEQSSTFYEYVRQSKSLRWLTIVGAQSEYMQHVVFACQKTNIDHITKLTLHVLNTVNINYASVEKFVGLKNISLYFYYGLWSEYNVINVLSSLRNATTLQRIRIYRVGDGDDSNHQRHLRFHTHINSFVIFFREKGVNIYTCTRTF